MSTQRRRADESVHLPPVIAVQSNAVAHLLNRIGASLLALLLSATCHAAPEAERVSDTETSAVLAVVKTLFDGMRSKDPDKLRSVFSEGASLGGTPVEKFVESVLASKAHLDEVTFDETVLIDGELAMAWTPYNIFVDGEFHHCGVDLFVMRKTDGEWKVRYLEDTRRSERCEEDRK